MNAKNNKKKRIAVIGLKGLPAFGGAATVGESIITRLSNKFEFTVYSVSSHTAEESGNLNGFEQIVFKSCNRKGLNTFIYFLKSLLHVLFFRKYDLIHLHHCSSGFVTPLLRLRYKVIVTFHGIHRENYFDAKFNRLTNIMLKGAQWMNLRFASRVISVSAPDADYLNARNQTKIEVIPNGVTVINTPPTRLGQKYWAFAAGRIYDIKGLHILLEAMRLNQSTKKLLIIGDMDHVAAYRENIEMLARGLNIEFRPLIKDKQKLFDILSGAELFVFPSLTEAMSMMLLEVASLNVPILASDIPANTSVFSDNEVLFFKSNDAKSLSEKLTFTENNKEILKDLAEAAQRKVCRDYNWEVISARYDEVFSQLMETPR